MARYIDAELLREQIDLGLDLDFSEVPETKACLLEMIDYQETADVKPVVHARWINHYDDLFPFDSTAECSNCHEEQGYDMLDDNYCPNCGAKMDEEVE